MDLTVEVLQRDDFSWLDEDDCICEPFKQDTNYVKFTECEVCGV